VLLDQARDELLAALPLVREGALLDAWFPHRQLSRERMGVYLKRVEQLVADFLAEAPNPDGHVYSLFVTTYRSPPYAQPPRTMDSGAGAEESTPP
jgi:hypothetical protein